MPFLLAPAEGIEGPFGPSRGVLQPNHVCTKMTYQIAVFLHFYQHCEKIVFRLLHPETARKPIDCKELVRKGSKKYKSVVFDQWGGEISWDQTLIAFFSLVEHMFYSITLNRLSRNTIVTYWLLRPLFLPVLVSVACGTASSFVLVLTRWLRSLVASSDNSASSCGGTQPHHGWGRGRVPFKNTF